MHKWQRVTFLWILLVGVSASDSTQNAQNATKSPQEEALLSEIETDMGVVDYESALRPAVLQKRSIINIARLLLGGNVPRNHPLVKDPEPKAWNLASNIVAAIPDGTGSTSQSSSTLQNIQQLFETKAKIIPYTGQVATGLTGLASVKGDIIRQIHSISTQAIAQAAADAATRALAGATAAHAVTNSIAQTINPGAQTGIKGGWSSFQNTYLEQFGKAPVEQPGSPYIDSNIYTNYYQTSPTSYSNNLVTSQSAPAHIRSTSASSATYPTRSQQQHLQPYQNGYYTLYNNQVSDSGTQANTPYTPAAPVANARPTLSPNTLIATTPSGYSPSLPKPLVPMLQESKSLPVIVYTPGSNNIPFNSFHRTVPASNFGSNAAQSSATSSLLSTISSILSASTAAYNQAFADASTAQQQQQLSSVYPNVPSASSSFSNNPSIFTSSSSGTNNSNRYQQPVDPISQQENGKHGRPSGRGNQNSLQHQQASYTETRASSINAPSYTFNQNGPGHSGTNFAQTTTNPYSFQRVQSPPQFSGGFSEQSPTGGTASNNPLPIRYGYSGHNAGTRSSSGDVGGRHPQNAGPSLSPLTWSSSHSSGQTSVGNNFSAPRDYGGSTVPFQNSNVASFVQEVYQTPATNGYQSSLVNSYAPTHSASFLPHYQLTQNPREFSHSIDMGRNSAYNGYDLRYSASSIGKDYKGGSSSTTPLNNQQTEYKNFHDSSKYLDYARAKPSQLLPPTYKLNNHYDKNKQQGLVRNYNIQGNGARIEVKENGKRKYSTGSKKGSNFDSAVDLLNVSDNEYYFEGDHYSSDSNEIEFDINFPGADENRWRVHNSSGQRPNSFHNHHSSGRWKGKTTHTKHIPPKNVRGNDREQKRFRAQPGPSEGSSSKKYGKGRNHHVYGRKQKKKRKQLGKHKPKSTRLYKEQHRLKKQSPISYKSKDIYTTLPEYVFRAGERPDIFLRPGGKQKKRRKSFFQGRGTLNPRIGDSDNTEETSLYYDENIDESKSSVDADLVRSVEVTESVDQTNSSEEGKEFPDTSEDGYEHTTSNTLSLNEAEITLNKKEKPGNAMDNFKSIVSQTIGLSLSPVSQQYSTISTKNEYEQEPVLIPAVPVFSTSFTQNP